MSRFLAVSREPVFSPGKISDDRAILESVAHELRRLGHDVAIVDADAEPWPDPDGTPIVFAMCQSASAIARLQAWEARRVRIINSSTGILNCQRHRTIATFAAHAEIAFAESVLVSTAAELPLPAWIECGGTWIKRGDVHAMQADDVAFVDTASAAHAALRRFYDRGIGQAVVQRHVAGTVLKFYGVHGGFFHCVPPPHTDGISSSVLQSVAGLGAAAAQALGVEIYGGDCVYDAACGLTLIDLNDWPSYAPCRIQAARAIAAYLHAQDVAIDT